MSESDDGEADDGPHGMGWLARPLQCAGRIVLDGLDLERLADSDLPGICLRMHVIFHTFEMPRCEERLMPVGIFDQMDTLDSMVLHGHGGPPRLVDWTSLISEFGQYYGLYGTGPIAVDETFFRQEVARHRP